jgi:hypothetical protein
LTFIRQRWKAALEFLEAAFRFCRQRLALSRNKKALLLRTKSANTLRGQVALLEAVKTSTGSDHEKMELNSKYPGTSPLFPIHGLFKI